MRCRQRRLEREAAAQEARRQYEADWVAEQKRLLKEVIAIVAKATNGEINAGPPRPITHPLTGHCERAAPSGAEAVAHRVWINAGAYVGNPLVRMGAACLRPPKVTTTAATIPP